MFAVILNGADLTSAPLVDAAARQAEAQLAAQGAQVRHFYLRDFSIGHCLGEFDCWVRTPGRCRIKDEGQEIERAVHDAQICIYVTPVTFGGYGPQLKKAVDRLIPLILPFFEKRADLTHHEQRYAVTPRLIGIGVDASPSAERSDLFSAIVESNALDMSASGWNAVTLSGDPGGWREEISAALTGAAKPGNAAGNAERARRHLEHMLCADEKAPLFPAPCSVAILQASARETGTSTSQAIADYLASQFSSRDAAVRIVRATDFVRGAAQAEEAASILANADVMVVASPLYVEALPYLGVLALEHVRRARSTGSRSQRVVFVVNCGFPEPEQTRYAFAILHEFAREARAVFAGGIAVGGGEAIHGRNLVKAGAMTASLRVSLESAAEALAAGGVIPNAVSVASTRPLLAPILYRFVGSIGWAFQAREHGHSLRDLRARPFDVISDAEWERAALAGAARARPLRVVGKRLETEDAATILFEDPAHDPLHYEAGQYTTLELTIDGERVRRAYSLSSAPHDPGLAITVKRVPVEQHRTTSTTASPLATSCALMGPRDDLR
jgi:multimeric flavodoxin WrbA